MKFPISEFDLLKIQRSRGWFLFAVGAIFWKHSEYSALFQVMCLQGKWTIELFYWRLLFRAIRKASPPA